MVSMSELFEVVFADTADLVHFPLLFFTSASWVAAWEVEIFPAVCRVRHAVVTLDVALRDVAGASLSLPTVGLEMYSSMEEVVPPPRPPCRGLCSCAGLRCAAVPGTSRCPHSAAQ
jgi:hypothetical protein